LQIIVDKKSAIIGLEGERTNPLDGNHLEIAKCSSMADKNFVTISGRLAILVEEIDKNRPEQKT
jgi:hypothetical protein